MVVMDHASFALKATVDDIEKAHGVASFESFVFSRGVKFFNPSCSFMTQGNGFRSIDGDESFANGHQVTMA